MIDGLGPNGRAIDPYKDPRNVLATLGVSPGLRKTMTRHVRTRKAYVRSGMARLPDKAREIASDEDGSS